MEFELVFLSTTKATEAVQFKIDCSITHFVTMVAWWDGVRHTHSMQDFGSEDLVVDTLREVEYDEVKHGEVIGSVGMEH